MFFESVHTKKPNIGYRGLTSQCASWTSWAVSLWNVGDSSLGPDCWACCCQCTSSSLCRVCTTCPSLPCHTGPCTWGLRTYVRWGTSGGCSPVTKYTTQLPSGHLPPQPVSPGWTWSRWSWKTSPYWLAKRLPCPHVWQAFPARSQTTCWIPAAEL